MNKTRIFIACVDERLRIALLLFLENEPGLAVVGITDRLRGLLPQLEASQTNVLLLEWQLDPKAINELLTKLHYLTDPPKVIYFCRDDEEKQKVQAAGADYVILKNAPPDELLPILAQIELQSTNR